MSDVSNQEIKELLIGLTQQVGGLAQEVKALNVRVGRLEEQYHALDKKIDVQYLALDNKIDTQYQALDSKIDLQFQILDKKVDVHHEELKGEMGRLSEKMDGLTKRVDNQEVLSRGATLALIAGVITVAVRFISFPQP